MPPRVRDATDRLDVLVSNAGVGSGEPDGRTRRVSADGFELRFAVNYLAGFLRTVQLLPLLRSSAPARVVNVASLGQYPLDFDDRTLETGVEATRRLAVDPALAGTTGCFFDRTMQARANPQAYDPDARAELWRRTSRTSSEGLTLTVRTVLGGVLVGRRLG